MKMMTEELKKKLLKASETESDIVLVHYFSLTGWDWYIVNAVEDGGELYLFGYVCGQFNEWGEVALSELEKLNAQHLVERDLYPQENLTAYEYAKFNGHNAGGVCAVHRDIFVVNPVQILISCIFE